MPLYDARRIGAVLRRVRPSLDKAGAAPARPQAQSCGLGGARRSKEVLPLPDISVLVRALAKHIIPDAAAALLRPTESERPRNFPTDAGTALARPAAPSAPQHKETHEWAQ